MNALVSIKYVKKRRKEGKNSTEKFPFNVDEGRYWSQAVTSLAR